MISLRYHRHLDDFVRSHQRTDSTDLSSFECRYSKVGKSEKRARLEGK